MEQHYHYKINHHKMMLHTLRNIAKYTVQVRSNSTLPPPQVQLGSISFMSNFGQPINSAIFSSLAPQFIYSAPMQNGLVSYQTVNMISNPQSANLVHQNYYNTFNVQYEVTFQGLFLSVYESQ